MSRWAKLTFPAPSVRACFRAWASMAGERSVHNTHAAFRAAARLRIPVPPAHSSTRLPGLTQSAVYRAMAWQARVLIF